jgi:hypothetical protein
MASMVSMPSICSKFETRGQDKTTRQDDKTTTAEKHRSIDIKYDNGFIFKKINEN